MRAPYFKQIASNKLKPRVLGAVSQFITPLHRVHFKIEICTHLVNIFLERMSHRYPLDTQVDDQTFSFHFYWNENGQLIRIGWGEESIVPIETQPPYGVAAIVRELKNFFATGEPLVPLHWSLLEIGAISDFSKKVYDAVLKIPHGETRTYAWVAFQIGNPLATRAVGQALRRNPFPILVPCHRVVSDKSIGGFMGANDPGDLELRFKGWLLDLERSYRNPYFDFMSSIPQLQERVS